MSQIYVSTHRKLNSGMLDGAWLTLEDYANKAEFMDACLELHEDEQQPELIFNSWEDIPSKYITEEFVHEELWDWLDLDDYDRGIAVTYFSEVDLNATPTEAIDAYCGQHDSEEDWARKLWEDSGMLSQLPDFAQNYIDYEKYAWNARHAGDSYFVDCETHILAFRRN